MASEFFAVLASLFSGYVYRVNVFSHSKIFLMGLAVGNSIFDPVFPSSERVKPLLMAIGKEKFIFGKLECEGMERNSGLGYENKGRRGRSHGSR